ncbi:alkaline dihydroceramidase KNAG_0A01840 [Huiozyma naganishii CBS 8797]|uniref:Uncharacterized protein n=1 Tax=Huiozyma naganishii (strain ATCC MYA-139 / BCRC 22969 / CBS 8797 / KCTC 17520 / NBRC 10181 / NCYC 3082 / Yp74L-3) TaxID=1071383 RepID=J7RE92_HUIN7|nr:hypothetical protein KNAG_0A01840 [Kazachstania naganishii CBS 8797]CCK67873.1 hypothetical protein KNAG_0A01840 [Kazachstania naganishii CBS 8797]
MALSRTTSKWWVLGETTAIIDWCEENYVVSKYVAEWSNTISNSMFLLTAAYSTYCAYRNGLERRFILIGLGFALVGVGSWLFHMTLKFRFQLLDELPMVYATAIPAWSVFCEFNWSTYRYHTEKVSPKKQLWMFFGIMSFVTALTYVYIKYRIVLLFQFLYGLLTIAVVAISTSFAYFMEAKDPMVKKNLCATMGLGIVLFSVGFVFWEMDQLFCPFWIHIRREYLALPLGVLLEMHGWWHLLTGMGVYTYLVALQYLRALTLGVDKDFTFIWRWGVIPEIIRNDLAITTKYSLEFWGPYISEGDNHTQESLPSTNRDVSVAQTADPMTGGKVVQTGQVQG